MTQDSNEEQCSELLQVDLEVRMKVSRIFNRLSLLMHALLSISLYFVIEALSRHSVGLAWSFMMERPLVFLITLPIFL